MTTTATQTTSSTAAVLDGLRAKAAEISRAEVEKAELTIEWAVLNEADPAECVGLFADKALPVAGAGAPLVSEFALMEYAAALGITTESGFAQVGRVLELRCRLPRLWARVVRREAGVVAGGPDRRADHLPARSGGRACGPVPRPGGPLVFLGAAGPAVGAARACLRRGGRPVCQHPVPDQRGPDQGVVRQPGREDHGQAGGRSQRARPCGGLRSTGPAQGPERSGRRSLRVPALRQTSARCDTDHVVPHDSGGPTSSDNTAPLCRRHHRAKTHSAWDYSVLDRGTYLWTSPNGLKLIRDHRGTHEP